MSLAAKRHLSRVAAKWVPAFGWEGLYEVSTNGQVRSVARPSDGKFGDRGPYEGKVLSPIKSRRTSYLVVNLTGGGRRKQVLLHRLVLESFVGPCPDGKEACHNNGNRHDASLANLRWDSRKNNHADKINHGTHPAGAKNPFARLTDAQAAYVKRSRDPLKTLAERFGVSVGCVSKIRYGQTWKHL